MCSFAGMAMTERLAILSVVFLCYNIIYLYYFLNNMHMCGVCGVVCQ